MSIEETRVQKGCLVEVQDGPMRVSGDPHNFGIVACLTNVSGFLYADVVTNTGHHRLISPDHLCVLNAPYDTHCGPQDSDDR